MTRIPVSGSGREEAPFLSEARPEKAATHPNPFSSTRLVSCPAAGGGNRLPPGVVKKMERQGREGGSHPSDRPSELVAKEMGTSGPAAVDAREAVALRLARRDWPARCDAAVRKYFSD